MRLVTSMGGVWRLSEKKYLAFLQAVALGLDSDLNDFGKYLGSSQEVTDMSAGEARAIWEDITGKELSDA